VKELQSRDQSEALATLSQSIIVDLDTRSETRLSAIWQELTAHADKAASRANEVEQGIFQRMQAVENDVTEQARTIAEQAKRKAAADAALQRLPPAHPGCAKLIDSLTWRVSWLEWSISGDKRSFSRPISEKAAMPWSQSELIHARATEDSELLVRDSSGQLRPRRQAKALMSRSETGEGFQSGAAERTFGQLRASKSQGKLQPLRPGL